MLAKVIIENGVKKIQALTADTGTGAPVGSYLYLEKKSNPQGYLYCDGSTFDETVYPALYQYLGTNVLPDWREFSAVGAEQNTTNVYDAQTNPNGVIHDHDVFAQGEAKDDQLQDHSHNAEVLDYDNSGAQSSVGLRDATTTDGGWNSFYVRVRSAFSARVGNITRGKSRAVFIYIKATSGLTENQQENVLNTINENNSYSTEEHPTGKKWIDGKPTYEKTFYGTSLPSNQIIGHIDNVDNVIKREGFVKNANDGNFLPMNYAGSINNYVASNGDVKLYSNNYSFSKYNVSLEYTKTTDN